MPVLTDLASAQIVASVTSLFGTVLSRPALLVSDGAHAIYACDVNVGPTDPTGRINQYNQQNGRGQIITDRNGLTIPNDLTGLPGQENYVADDSITTNTVLHDVVIASNNATLIYADIGCPVSLTRSASGQWQITGFSQEQPGTFILVPVDLGTTFIGLNSDKLSGATPGPPIDLSISVRLLTLGELGTFVPFGFAPLGASAMYIGGRFIRIV